MNGVLSQLNPFVRYARNQINLRQKDSLSICYDCRLYMLHSGSATIEINGDTHSVYENALIYLPPRSKYRFLAQENRNFSMLVFNFDLVDDYCCLRSSLGTADSSAFDPTRCPDYAIPECFAAPIIQCIPDAYEPLERCIRDFLNNTPYHRESASAALKTVLLEMLKSHNVDHKQRLARQITDYIHSHFSEPELTNSKIAEQFGYHPYYLSQLLKRSTGKTLHNYLIYYRIRIAKNYLITTDWDVETISWRSGFNSVSHFIKLFREHTGVTPLHYRRQHANSTL